MVNTEKPTTKQEQKKQEAVKTPKKVDIKQPLPNQEKKEKKIEVEETKIEKAKDEKKETKEKVAKLKVKKTEVIVRVSNLPLSTKQSTAICKFIKHKKISQAIKNLEEVSRLKKPIPMKGELPHQKGIMSGKYPVKASKQFIVLLKSLASNADANELNEPIIKEAIANIGARPYGRFGRIQRKRSHIFIKAVEKKIKKKENKKTP